LSKPEESRNESEESREKNKEEEAAKKGKEEPYAVDISALDVHTTLKLFLNILAGQAWMKIGLTVNPRTNKIEKDMNQARIAIDCFQFISRQLEGHLSEEEKRRINNLLSDLQMNYATHQ